jgi:hypothetical protein
LLGQAARVLEGVGPISRETIRRTLKKTASNLGASRISDPPSDPQGVAEDVHHVQRLPVDLLDHPRAVLDAPPGKPGGEPENRKRKQKDQGKRLDKLEFFWRWTSLAEKWEKQVFCRAVCSAVSRLI